MASANLYCSLSGCDCKTQNGQEYCSEYCKQAARHAPERDYCQCGHTGCASQIPLGGTLFDYQLSDTVFLAPGQVTIHCTSAEQLCHDLELLAKALRERLDDLWKRVEPATPRRPMGSEIQRPLMSAKTA